MTTPKTSAQHKLLAVDDAFSASFMASQISKFGRLAGVSITLTRGFPLKTNCLQFS
jgi:hypothetical protein